MPLRAQEEPDSARHGRDATLNLHNHTYCSDGSDSPETLVELARRAGVRTLAVTDHDTTACLARGRAAAAEAGVRFVPGVEISAEDDSIHILALNVDASDAALLGLLERNSRARLERAREIVAKLRSGGLRVELKDVLVDKLDARRAADGKAPLPPERAGAAAEGELLAELDTPLTRPDIARTLVGRGYARDFREAFDRYLGDQGEAAADMQGPPVAEVFRVVHAAGGIAVLAHPHTIYKFKARPWTYSGKPYTDFAALLEDLFEAGLDGVEQYKNQHGPERSIAEAANRYSRRTGRRVVFTPGSDYHGSSGAGQPDLLAISVPKSTADALRDALDRRREPVAGGSVRRRALGAPEVQRVDAAIRRHFEPR